MTDRRAVCVIGGGRIAAACSTALARAGVEIVDTKDDLKGCDILSAAFDGRATLTAMAALNLEGVRTFVDLATQSIAEAHATEAMCEKHAITYFAGGLTGGVSQVGSSECTIILGSSRPDAEPPAWVDHLGRPAPQATLTASVTAKLLHNFVLIVANQALGAALHLAEDAGVSDFPAILAAGTAGRPLKEASALRDRYRGFTSSYSSSLVAKDLRAMVDSLPELRELCAIDLPQLAAAHEPWGDMPYTCFANSQLSAGQHMIGDILVSRARRAEQRYRDRLSRDLENLARAFPEADAAFQPTRRNSPHDYDISARVRVLEAHACSPPDFREGIEIDAPVELSEVDEAMFMDAVALILSDQDHLARTMAGQ